VLLYLLATGRFPVSARSLRDLRDAHAAGTRLSVRADRPDFPVQIADVIERALDSNAQRRFATADDMRLVLDRSAARRRLRSQIRSHAAFAAATMALVAATSVLTWNLRAHNTRVFDEKHWVQVADFENRTGEPVFDDGTVRVALLRELSRATTLNVVPAAAASLPSTAVNRETGEIVTRTETSRGLLPNVTIAGSIAKDGRGYVLTAGVVRATDTHVVSRFSERAGVQTQLLEAVTKLGASHARRCGRTHQRSTGATVSCFASRTAAVLASARSLAKHEP
jgi:hypothetical protein